MTTVGRLVLLVDDDAGIRAALTDFLLDEGFVVHTAQNGREALEWLRGNGGRPTVVLLDLMMPVMDGQAFLEARACDPELSQIPVVVVSADPRRAELASGHERCVVIGKPVAPEGLLQAIDVVSVA
jgi:CheY-like chemotaxis protein